MLQPSRKPSEICAACSSSSWHTCISISTAIGTPQVYRVSKRPAIVELLGMSGKGGLSRAARGDVMPNEIQSVSVIIAAWNAEATIGRAIASALIQQEVCEVLVIDDRSTDATVATARAADDGTDRVRVVSLDRNSGPAAARNAGLSLSRAPFVAVLDADDFLLPDRFAALFAIPDWDAIADNIAFITSDELPDFKTSDIREFETEPQVLTFASFVERNISRRGAARRELGFAKPVMRRAFLEKAALRYDEALRLGEDYALYTSMMLRGARFLTTRRCGYVAVERSTSLSAQHRTHDLAALFAYDKRLEVEAEGLPAPAKASVKRHSTQLAGMVRHRTFLDIKRERGALAALAYAAAEPLMLPRLVGAIAADKLLATPVRAKGVAYLL
ncbi:glycosyltransferase [Sphingomonas sp. RB3P16]|uniref:glycosyltransferase family 2 protein n=1 Tax=Parasphingomonas frigoris TaxID=3096163 RepID=UPI002FC62070